jgi:hypothetical protein
MGMGALCNDWDGCATGLLLNKLRKHIGLGHNKPHIELHGLGQRVSPGM